MRKASTSSKSLDAFIQCDKVHSWQQKLSFRKRITLPKTSAKISTVQFRILVYQSERWSSRNRQYAMLGLGESSPPCLIVNVEIELKEDYFGGSDCYFDLDIVVDYLAKQGQVAFASYGPSGSLNIDESHPIEAWFPQSLEVSLFDSSKAAELSADYKPYEKINFRADERKIFRASNSTYEGGLASAFAMSDKKFVKDLPYDD